MNGSKILLCAIYCLLLLSVAGCDWGTGTLNLDTTDATMPPIDVRPKTTGGNLEIELQKFAETAQSGREYTIEVIGNGHICSQNISFPGRHNITIRLVGNERERIIQLSDSGALFDIGSGVTLIIGENITLRGRINNTSELININTGAALIMRSGAKITSNTNTHNSAMAGGVIVRSGGGFLMEGGEIYKNTINNNAWGSPARAGGVMVETGGEFEMRGGSISGSNHGGVRVGGHFVMLNGEIRDNSGVGVHVNGGVFTMENGRIFRNTAANGAGVNVQNARFSMTGGEIFGNTADNSGGGVFVAANSTFTKSGGTIHGHNSGTGNTATDGIASNNRGHAVFVDTNPSRRRESTAGAHLELNSAIVGAAGGWE